jgi:crossover junction endodeoxyribonuclease RuvC
MTGRLILGIDPGLDGALALVDGPTGALVNVYDTPVLTLKTGRQLDEYKLAALVDEWGSNLSEAWIERANAHPHGGVTSSFTSGRGYGQLRGIICANFVPLHDVGAAMWKRALGVTGDKDESRKAASAIWPKEGFRWPLKKHHGRAEAALIAVYGRRAWLKEHQELQEAANA